MTICVHCHGETKIYLYLIALNGERFPIHKKCLEEWKKSPELQGYANQSVVQGLNADNVYSRIAKSDFYPLYRGVRIKRVEGCYEDLYCGIRKKHKVCLTRIIFNKMLRILGGECHRRYLSNGVVRVRGDIQLDKKIMSIMSNLEISLLTVWS